MFTRRLVKIEYTLYFRPLTRVTYSVAEGGDGDEFRPQRVEPP